MPAPIAETPEAVLVSAARDGDLEAFEALVRRHQHAVYRVALRMLGSEADAEDVAQDAFVHAWRSLGRFRGDSAFGTWLYRITTNRALNALASRRPAVELEERVAPHAERPERVLERREQLEAVTGALLRLAPEQRALLVLREFEGLSYAELAEVLGVPERLVKGRLHRARTALVAETGGLA